jgi:dTDP-4-amino-4,6-dideoxygalactose transaminase
VVPEYATNNAHMFYLLCDSLRTRTALIDHLKSQGILSVFHYLSLHKSPYFQGRHDGRPLEHADRYSDCLLRLPLYYELSEDDLGRVTDSIFGFYDQRRGARTC